MLDNPAFHDEDDVFGDVGGQVGDALQIPDDDEKMVQPRYPARLLDHASQNPLNILIVQQVHFHIPLTHLDGQLGVLVHEGQWPPELKS